MKHILTIISSAILFLLPLGAYGQQPTTAHPLKVTVVDQFGPLASVSVYLENQDQRTIKGGVTDYNGTHIIAVPAGYTNLTLVVSYVGYNTQRIPYTNQTDVNITLVESSTTLGQAVVEAEEFRRLSEFGLDPTTQGVTSQVVMIDDLRDIPAVTVEDMLIGKVVGLDIVSGGDPGSVATMRIRGTSSINANNQPLIVIDNIPQYDIKFDAAFDFTSAEVQDYGALMNLSPNDIESIEVIKDMAAAAAWGPQAAYGVLLVQTKKGGNHTPRIDFNERITYSLKPRSRSLLNGPEYTTLVQDAMWNWVRDGNFDPKRLEKLEGQRDILYDKSWQYYREYSQDTDWLDLVEQNSLNTDTNVSLSGGGEKATYRLSLSYTTDKGDYKNSKYHRINALLNSDYRFSNKFTVTSRFEYSEGVQNLAYDYDGQTPRGTAMKKMPNMSPWVLDANGNPTDEYFTAPIGEGVLQDKLINPLALVEESTNKNVTRNMSAQFNMDYRFNSYLTARASVQFSLTARDTDKFLPESVTSLKWSDDNYNRGVEERYSAAGTTMILNLMYNRIFNQKHAVNIGLRENLHAATNEIYSVHTAAGGEKSVSVPSAGGKVVDMNSSRSLGRSIDLSASASYTYDRRYSATLQVYSSTNEARAANYEQLWSPPKFTVNGKWEASNEKWLPIDREGWWSNLSVGGNYGVSMGYPGGAGYATYAEKGYYGREGVESNRWFSIVPENMQLVKLQPEINTGYGFYLESGFLKDRIFFQVNHYNETTSNQAQTDAPIPSNTGYTKVSSYNSGEVRNSGWEVRVSFRDFLVLGNEGSTQGVDKRLRFSLSDLNMSWNKNRLIEVPDNLNTEKYTLKNGELAGKVLQGVPLGAFYGFQHAGVYQNYDETRALDWNGRPIVDMNGNPVRTRIGGTSVRPGDSKYVDQNYDGIIDENDLVYLGTANPTVYGGATLHVRWREFTLGLSMQLRLGSSIYNQSRLETEQMQDGNNQSTSVLSRWRYEGDKTSIPRALWDLNYNSLVSDYYIEDGSYFKLRTISLKYDLPRKFVSKIGIERASITVTAQNMLTLTKYTGTDPEVTQSGEYRLAKDNSRSAVPRKIAAYLSFSF